MPCLYGNDKGDTGMKYKLSVSVMCAPFDEFRRENVEQMIKDIGVWEIQNMTCHFNIIQDWHKRGVWETAKLAWMDSFGKGSTHHLVLQDDVKVCKNFIDTVYSLIKAKPNDPMCFYANRKVCEKAKEEDARWVSIPDGIWGQAVLLPVDMVQDFLMWEIEHIRPDFKHDDSRLAMYCVKKKTPVMCPMPSIVEHNGATRSVLGQSNKNKVARWFIGDNNSLDYDWKTGKVIKGANNISKGYWDYYNG